MVWEMEQLSIRQQAATQALYDYEYRLAMEALEAKAAPVEKSPEPPTKTRESGSSGGESALQQAQRKLGYAQTAEDFEKVGWLLEVVEAMLRHSESQEQPATTEKATTAGPSAAVGPTGHPIPPSPPALGEREAAVLTHVEQCSYCRVRLDKWSSWFRTPAQDAAGRT